MARAAARDQRGTAACQAKDAETNGKQGRPRASLDVSMGSEVAERASRRWPGGTLERSPSLPALDGGVTVDCPDPEHPAPPGGRGAGYLSSACPSVPVSANRLSLRPAMRRQSVLWIPAAVATSLLTEVVLFLPAHAPSIRKQPDHGQRHPRGGHQELHRPLQIGEGARCNLPAVVG